MLIKNLLIKFVSRQGDKLIFQTDSGAEISLASHLLEDKFDENQSYYISIDSNAMKAIDESQKKILNELIGNDVEGQD